MSTETVAVVKLAVVVVATAGGVDVEGQATEAGAVAVAAVAAEEGGLGMAAAD